MTARVFGMVTMQRSWEYTSYALKSFARYTALTDQDTVLLIDNDGSFGPPPTWLIPTVELMSRATPFSFAANFNALIEEARARHADLYVLDNDLIFTEGWQEPLAAAQGIVSAVSNREYQYEIDGVLWGRTLDLSDYLRNPRSFQRAAAKHRETVPHIRQRVLATPFFCVRIPFAVFDTLGMLDEELSTGGEDIDYCFRAWLAGIPVECAAASFVLHFKGKSARSASTAQNPAQMPEAPLRFEQKWGAELRRLTVDNDPNILLQHPEVADRLESADFGEVIRVLRPS